MSIWASPSDLPVGTEARFIHAKTGAEIVAVVIESGGDSCVVREVNEDGLKKVQAKIEIFDKIYMVKEYDGNEMF